MSTDLNAMAKDSNVGRTKRLGTMCAFNVIYRALVAYRRQCDAASGELE